LICAYRGKKDRPYGIAQLLNRRGQDYLSIIEIFGRLKDPIVSGDIGRSLKFVSEKGMIAALKTLKILKSPNAVLSIKGLLNHGDKKIRWQAIDTLSYIKTNASMESILPKLFDKDHDIRWKAVQALGEIGNPQAADRISLLLADPDESVRGIAENVLMKLGTPEAQIADWKKKAGQLSIDDVYRTQLAYQRAEIEKEELVNKLKSETDLKKQMENSLKSRETALAKQKQLVDSLYEKERQLKSKQAQLTITQQQSEQYQNELLKLNAKAQSLNAELKQAKSQAATDSVKKELDKTLETKSKLEVEAKNSQEKESVLLEEIETLNALAEKTRLEARNTKKELAALRNREKQLAAQVDELKQRLDRGMAPVIVVSKPESGSKIESSNTLLHFIAVDDKGISKVNVFLNEKSVKINDSRGIKIADADSNKISKKIDMTGKLQLQNGLNIIKISVVDTDGISQEELIEIFRVKERGDIWAIVIGINQYLNTRNLKYAVNDAQAFKDYLKDYVGIPDERIFYLVNQEATKSKIESLLGTTIKRKASRDDTVIIFYAGHGAVEPDSSNLDGDGFEKYLLPHDANLKDLYSTSISMNDIKTIFMRIRADRLIFIADTCYSGASGGRTIMSTKTRANLSDKFYERISKGKGRVIISSCSANEISKEDDTLQHGVFSYYMLEGLRGQSDQDGDGIITVSELFSYISRKVPQASGQDQHPVKKGETEGELVIGRVK
jgi:HEAT repeat protein